MMEDCFLIDEQSPDNKWVTVFEDDGETGTLYLCRCDESEDVEMIVDGLLVYKNLYPPIFPYRDVFIIWSEDSKRVAVIIDEECWAMFDIASKRKLAVKREDDVFISIPRSTWDNGIDAEQGDTLCLDKEFQYKGKPE